MRDDKRLIQRKNDQKINEQRLKLDEKTRAEQHDLDERKFKEECLKNKNIPKNRKLWAKSFWQRFLIMFSGAGFNFIFAILLLFIIGISYGSVSPKPIIGSVSENYPSYEAGLRDGDTVLSIDNVDVKTWMI